MSEQLPFRRQRDETGEVHHPSPLTPCGRTQEMLDQLLKESYGQPLFQAYFFFNKDALTPYKVESHLLSDAIRCKGCGCTIDVHH